jgi:hypothetical protein
VQLHRELPHIHASGAELVFIGNGNRHFAAGFRDELRLQTPLYVDTKRDAYRALGMKRSFASIFSPRAVKSMVRAWRAGYRQKGVQGDAWQMGGVLVVRKGGEVAYSYLADAPGDHPPVADVLAALPA